MFSNLFGFELVEPETDRTSLVGAFLTGWVELERLLSEKSSEADGATRKRGTLDMVSRLKLNGSLTSNDAAEIDELRKLRNEVAHGMSDHSTITDQRGVERLRHLVTKLRSE
jgi:hypothetical protein